MQTDPHEEHDKQDGPRRQRYGSYLHTSLWDVDLAHRFCPAVKSREISHNDAAGEIIEKFGQSFVWDEKLHWRVEQLAPLRLVGDEPMDEVLKQLETSPADDILKCLRGAAAQDEDGVASRFLRSVAEVPEWVDWGLISQGQQVFCRHLPVAGAVLYNMSLVGGFSAPLITKVLEQSGYLVGAPHAVMKRLLDTGRLLVDSCASEGALRPGADGWSSALRVRAQFQRSLCAR